jgi:thiamine-phosphate pyrophosphorylase
VRTKPLLCLVSDRLRLAENAGRPHADARRLLLVQVRGAIQGGIDLVQIRERDLEAGDLARLVSDVVAIARGSATRVLVNDRADVAIASGADGVHLRETSIATRDLRRLSATLVVGRSVHSVARLREAGGVDYVIAGTVFPTASKGAPAATLGVVGLEEIVRAAGTIPVLAIGGVSLARVAEVRRAGAAGIAAIGAFIPAVDRDDLGTAVQKSVESMRSAFAAAASVSQNR